MTLPGGEFRSPELYTLGYLDWRRTIARDYERLDEIVSELTLEAAQAAFDSAIVGFTAERLNPDASQGDFHFARGLLLGHICKLKKSPP